MALGEAVPWGWVEHIRDETMIMRYQSTRKNIIYHTIYLHRCLLYTPDDLLRL